MEKCPYNCKNGLAFNTVTGRREPCPHCSTRLKPLEEVKEDSEVLTKECKRLHIPTNVPQFDPTKFFDASAKNLYVESSFKPVLTFLTELETAIQHGSLIYKSYYIFLGNACDKDAYINRCLLNAITHGLTAVPFISALSLSALRNGETHTETYYSDVNYFDYLAADLCFISLTAATMKHEHYILAELIEERARRQLPTYVLGYWSPNGVKKYGNNSLRYLISEDSNRLNLLSPIGVETIEGLEKDIAETDREINSRIEVSRTQPIFH